jgi:hypothetical protein
MRKVKMNTGVMWTASHVGKIDEFVVYLQQRTDFAGISRSSVTEMMQGMAFKLFPALPFDRMSDAIDGLTDEEQVLLDEIANYVNFERP